MLMHYNRGNQTIWRLAGRGIVGLSLATLTVAISQGLAPRAIASVIPSGSVADRDSDRLAKAAAELPIVESSALGTNMDVPWSQPVRIIDPFEGDYVGIFDRNFFVKRFLNTDARVEVISLWSRNSVRFLLAYGDRDCLSTLSFYPSLGNTNCITSNTTLKITDLYIKVGDRVFRLEGQNNTFQVSDELATALKNLPPGNVSIRLVAETGASVDSEIGEKTVQAWKEIY